MEVGRVGFGPSSRQLIWNVREVGDVARTVEEWWAQVLGPPFQIEGKELRILQGRNRLVPERWRKMRKTLVSNAEAGSRSERNG